MDLKEPMRLDKNDELLLYRKRVGDAEYRRQYETLYRFARQSKRRHSGNDYSNSKERLQSLKEKYKNGVSLDTIKEMVGI